jgi:hypothetical protein
MVAKTIPVYTVMAAPPYAAIDVGEVLTLQKAAEFFEQNAAEMAARSHGAAKVYMNIQLGARLDKYELAVSWS